MKKIIICIMTLVIAVSVCAIDLPQIVVTQPMGSLTTDPDHPVIYSVDNNHQTGWELIAGSTSGWSRYQFSERKSLFGFQVDSAVTGNVYIQLVYRNNAGELVKAFSVLRNKLSGGEQFIDASFDSIITDEVELTVLLEDGALCSINEIAFFGENPTTRSVKISPDSITSGSSTSYYAPEQSLIDGNPSTQWMTERNPQWQHIYPAVIKVLENRFAYNRSQVNWGQGYATVFFDQGVSLDSIRIYEVENAFGFYDVDYFDGTQWVKILNDRELGVESGWLEVFINQEVSIYQVKITVQDMNMPDTGGIGEIEFWGKGEPHTDEMISLSDPSINSDGPDGFSFFEWDNSNELPLQLILAAKDTPVLTLNGHELIPNKEKNFDEYNLLSYSLKQNSLYNGTNFIEYSNADEILQVSLSVKDPQRTWNNGNDSLSDGFLFTSIDGDNVFSIQNQKMFSKRIELFGIDTNIPDFYELSELSDGDIWTSINTIIDSDIAKVIDIQDKIKRIRSDEYLGTLAEIRVIGSSIPENIPGGRILYPRTMDHIPFYDIGYDVLVGQSLSQNQTVYINGVKAEQYLDIFWVRLKDINLPDAGLAEITIKYKNSDNLEIFSTHRINIESSGYPIEFYQDDIVYTTNDTFTLSGRANGAIHTLFIDDKPFGISGMGFSQTLQLNPGLNTFKVEIRDKRKGTPVYYREQKVIRVTAPLSIKITAPDNGSVTNKNTMSVSGRVTGYGKMTLTLDGAVVPVINGKFSSTLSSLSEGEHISYLHVTDMFGREAAATVSFVVDQTRPQMTVEQPTDYAIIADSIVKFRGQVSDLTQAWVIIDGYSTSVIDGYFNSDREYADNHYSIPIYAIDKAGNVSDIKYCPITVDTTAPLEFDILGISDAWTNNVPTITFQTSDATSGVDHYELSVEGSEFSAISSPHILNEIKLYEEENVPKKIIVKAVDKAGWPTISEAIVKYDSTAPIAPGSISAIPGNDHESLSWILDDESISYFEIERIPAWAEGTTTIVQEKSFIDTAIQFGEEYSYRIRAVDKAGNIGEYSESVSCIGGIEEELVLSDNVTQLKYEGTELYIQKDSLNDDVAKVTITQVTSEDLLNEAITTVLSPIFEYSLVDKNGNKVSGSVEFEKDYVGSIEYDPSLLPDGYPEERIGVFYFEPEWNRWIELPNANVDPETNTVYFTSHHFTEVAAQASPVPELSDEEIENSGYSPLKSYTAHESVLVSPQSGEVSTSFTEFVIPNPNGFNLEIKRRYDYGDARLDYRYDIVSSEDVVDGSYTSADEDTTTSTMASWVLPYLNDQGDYAYSMGKGWRLDFPYIRNASTSKSIVLPGGSSLLLWGMEKVKDKIITTKDGNNKDVETRYIFLESHRTQHVKLRVIQQKQMKYKYYGSGSALISKDIPVWGDIGYDLILKDGTRYQLDAKGRTAKIWSPDGMNYIDFVYDEGTEANNYADGSPKLLYIIDKLGHRVDFTYTDVNDYPMIKTITYKGVDGDKDGTYEKLNGSQAISYTQDDSGNLITATDIKGREFKYAYGVYGIDAFQSPVTFSLTSAVEGIGIPALTNKIIGVQPEPIVMRIKTLEKLSGPGIGSNFIQYTYHTIHEDIESDNEDEDSDETERNFFPRYVVQTVYVKNDPEDVVSGNITGRSTNYDYTFGYATKTSGAEYPVITSTIEIDGQRQNEYLYETVELPLYRWKADEENENELIEVSGDNKTVIFTRQTSEITRNSSSSMIYKSEIRDYNDGELTNVLLPTTITLINGSDITTSGITTFPNISESCTYDTWGNKVSSSVVQTLYDRSTKYEVYNHFLHMGDLPASTSSDMAWKSYSDAFSKIYSTSDWYNEDTGELASTEINMRHNLLLAKQIVNYVPDNSIGISDIESCAEQQQYKYFDYNDYGQMEGIAEWSSKSTDNTGKWYITSYIYDNDDGAVGNLHCGALKEITHFDSINAVAVVNQKTEFSYNNTTGYLETKTEKDIANSLNGTTNDIVTNYSFDRVSGLVSSETNPREKMTSYEYDSLGRITKITHPKEAAESDVITSIAYDDTMNALVARVTDPEGLITRYFFNNLGDLIRLQKGAGAELSKTQFFYNRWGQISKIINPLGWEATNETDREKYSTFYEYDDMGRKTAIIYPHEGNPIPKKLFNYTYSTNSLTIVDENGHSSSQQFDMYNRLLSSSHDDINDEVNYYYDGLGNVIRYTDEANYATTFEYDTRNLKIQTTLPEETFTEWNLTTQTTVTTSPQLTFEYDYAKRLVLETMDAPGQGMSHDAILSNVITYDGLGRIIKTERYGSHIASDSFVPLQTKKQVWDGNGNLVKFIDTDGKLTEYTYTARDKVLSVSIFETHTAGVGTNSVDAQGYKPNYKTVYTYYLNDQLQTVTDPRGVATTANTTDFMVEYSYNTRNQIDTIETPAKIEGGNRVSTEFEYNLDGDLIEQTDPDGKRTSITYNYRNWKTSIEVSNEEDEDYSVVTLKTTYGYDDVGNIVSEINPQLNETKYKYDALNRLTEIEYPMHNKEYYGYDIRGNRTSISPKKSDETYATIMAYDAYNRISSIQLPETQSNESIIKKYDRLGNMVYEEDAINNIRKMTYDDLNRINVETDAEGYTVDYDWDLASNLIKVTDKNGQVFEYDYNVYNMVKGENVNSGGITRSYLYDLAGDLAQASIHKGAGKTVTTSYNYNASNAYNADAYGRITATRDSIAYSGLNKSIGFTYNYDSGDRISALGYNTGEAVGYSYDALGQLHDITSTLNNISNDYTSDNGIVWEDGQVSSITANNNVASAVSYDANGRLSSLTYNNSTNQLKSYSYQYDDISNNISWVNNNQYIYDKQNRLIAADLHGGFTTPSGYAEEQYGYVDDDYFGKYGLNFVEKTVEDEEISFDYSARSIGLNLGEPRDISRILLRANTGGSNRVIPETIELYKASENEDTKYQIINRSNYDISTVANENTLSYEIIFHIPINTKYLKIKNLFDDRDVDIDAVDRSQFSNKLSEMIQVFYVANNRTESYDYDALGNRKNAAIRTTGEIENDYVYYQNTSRLACDGTYVYRYDNNGNMTDKGTVIQIDSVGYTASEIPDTYWTSNNLNSTNVTYSSTKGTLWHYEFDALNNLTEVSKNGNVVAEYIYNAEGMRIVKSNSHVKNFYGFGLNGELLYEGTDKNDDGVVDKEITYVYASGKLFAMNKIEDNITTRYYLHTDHLGSVVSVTDTNGTELWNNEYTPFGEIAMEKSGNSIYALFTAKQLDHDTGLYYFNHRWYDPEIGRFISEDPIRDGLSWYAYCNNNPINFIDPNGLNTYDWTTNTWVSTLPNNDQNNPSSGVSEEELKKQKEKDWEDFREKFNNSNLSMDELMELAGDYNAKYNKGYDHSATELVTKDFLDGKTSLKTYKKQLNVIENFHKWTGGKSLKKVLEEYKTATAKDLSLQDLLRLFHDPLFAFGKLMSDKTIHQDLRTILNSNVPQNRNEANEFGWTFLGKYNPFVNLFHGWWAGNEKYIALDGRREVIMDDAGRIVGINKWKGTFNFFAPSNAVGHFFTDMVPYFRWGGN